MRVIASSDCAIKIEKRRREQIAKVIYVFYFVLHAVLNCIVSSVPILCSVHFFFSFHTPFCRKMPKRIENGGKQEKKPRKRGNIWTHEDTEKLASLIIKYGMHGILNNSTNGATVEHSRKIRNGPILSFATIPVPR